MRIISGNFKGKKIALPKDNKTRPLRDLVKESIFNLLEHSNKFNCNVKNSIVLDLFSGTGSFGLECISRGAQKVIFVENYKEALHVLKKNTLTLSTSLNQKYEIIEESCFNLFNFRKSFNEKFDLIFMDPPYKETKINNIIDQIKQKEILKESGIIIIHRHKKDNVFISKKIKILDERTYGISKILIAN
tara:strand:- start:849 stop:1415 length:567 start_codon:yes stop_codon:yes gene_type:complete